MKIRFVLFFIIVFGSAMKTQAQEQGFQRPTVEERVKVMVNKIAGPLALNPTQKMKASVVYTNYYAGLDKIRGGLAGGGKPEKPDMEKFTGDRDQKLKSIFTEEQYTKFKDTVEPSLRRPRSNIPVNN